MKTITGNTYPVRAELKALGGNWNRAQQGWDVPDEKAAQAQAMVDAAPASSGYGRRRGGYRSTYTRFSSGAEVYTNKRGRCEDAPCCGCCS